MKRKEYLFSGPFSASRTVFSGSPSSRNPLFNASCARSYFVGWVRFRSASMDAAGNGTLLQSLLLCDVLFIECEKPA